MTTASQVRIKLVKQVQKTTVNTKDRIVAAGSKLAGEIRAMFAAAVASEVAPVFARA